ncbi:MAG: hypothetical protein ABIJ18_01225 [archaeon]
MVLGRNIGGGGGGTALPLILGLICIGLGLGYIGIWEMYNFLPSDILEISTGVILFLAAGFLFFEVFRRKY